MLEEFLRNNDTICEVCLQFLSTPNFDTSTDCEPIFKQNDHFQIYWHGTESRNIVQKKKINKRTLNCIKGTQEFPFTAIKLHLVINRWWDRNIDNSNLLNSTYT